MFKILLILLFLGTIASFGSLYYNYRMYKETSLTQDAKTEVEYTQSPTPTPFLFMQKDMEEVVRLTNEYRAAKKLNSLKINEKLNLSALDKAEDMIEQDYWSHTDNRGRPIWFFHTKRGYDYVRAGENLARDYFSPRDIIEAWQSSPSHNENLINPFYKDVGVNFKCGELIDQYTCVVVMHLGQPTNPVVKGATIVIEPTVTDSPSVVVTPSSNLVNCWYNRSDGSFEFNFGTISKAECDARMKDHQASQKRLLDYLNQPQPTMVMPTWPSLSN